MQGREPPKIDHGELFDISDIKKVQIKEFNNKIYVDFREFFQKRDGTYAPSKKGLSFTVEHWECFLSKIDEINKALAKKTANMSSASID